MKRHALSFIAALVVFAMTLPVMAAPLFPDVPDNHWARDAVAALAAQGLVEGYPDGTFKGDRAATRWEVAMIVARLLAKMEQAHATFATKAELQEVRRLVNSLRDELDALGVRVTNLEENVSRLDKRVTNLERITFYGSVDARATFQSFTSSSRNDNDSNRFGGGNFASPATPYLNYNNLVGTIFGSQMSLANSGVMPVVDYRNGRALTNGTGFTSSAILGMRIRVTNNIDAGAQFAAYTAQGDQVVSSYWGVSAPYLSNQWTGMGNSAGYFSQPSSNQPYTRMTLDNFWIVDNPSQTKLVLGSFSTTHLDSDIYSGQYNPNAFGPEFNPNFGFDLTGRVNIEDAGVFKWEVLGTELATGGVSDYPYNDFLLGTDVAFEFQGGEIKANFARVADEASGGNPLYGGGIGDSTFTDEIVPPSVAIGSIGPAATNVNYGAGAASGWTPLQWVNPPGYYAAQRSAFEQAHGGVGTTADTRPIPGWNSMADNALGGATGGFGPQGENLYGISGQYKWDLSDGDQIYVNGNWGHSDYTPNKNSSYSVGGDAGRVGVGADLFDGNLDLGLSYITVDPTYDPFVLTYPWGSAGVVRLPDLNYYTNLWSLHDTHTYPQNREGVRFKGTWRFDERRGSVWAKAGWLNQKRTSLYDVRVLASGVAGGAPTDNVLGFSPGFMDPVFAGYATPAIYGTGSANSFTDSLAPLENPRGSVDNYGVGVTYKWDDPRVKISAGFERNDFTRHSGLSPAFGGSQNDVDLHITSIHGEVAWQADNQWTLHGGADVVTIAGHYDPSGLYNPYAIAIGSNSFDTVNNDQYVPFIGFNYNMSENTQWNMDLRYYTTQDNLNIPTTPTLDAIGRSQHPFEWSGWQVTTQFKVKF